MIVLTDFESRYNLKRRVASLPPLSSEVFSEKVLSAQAISTAAAARASFERNCNLCLKTYFSENAYQNHVGSQKHKTKALAAPRNKDEDGEVGSIATSTFTLGDSVHTETTVGHDDPEVSEEFSKVVQGIKDARLAEPELGAGRPSGQNPSASEQRPDPLLYPETKQTTSTVDGSKGSQSDEICSCLFCNYKSPTLALNISHMGRQHGMFIPEQPYLVDTKGLIRYLSEKVHEDHQCFFCNKSKGTTAGVQTHMRDKGHCMIAFESEEEMIEVGQFYDFRSTYSDDEEDEEDESSDDTGAKGSSGGVKLGARRDPKGKTLTSNGQGEEDGWETDSSVSSVASENIGRVYADPSERYAKLAHHPHHSHFDHRPHHNIDGWHSHAHSHRAVYYADYELHLPSGKAVGHRSLNRYYRQNLYGRSIGRLQSPPPPHRAIQDDTDSSDAETEPEEDQQPQQQQALVHRQRDRARQLAGRANGGLGMVGVSAAKKSEVTAMEKRERKCEQRGRTRYEWGNNKRANAQKHFRVSHVHKTPRNPENIRLILFIGPPTPVGSYYYAYPSRSTSFSHTTSLLAFLAIPVASDGSSNGVSLTLRRTHELTGWRDH
ncbi:MAG: hypothetical protein M1824_005595 [Vezdaea acicularis]|nr:MAG: hypothetical protein M1824_005595 [Vezdaea acicularis]